MAHSYNSLSDTILSPYLASPKYACRSTRCILNMPGNVPPNSDTQDKMRALGWPRGYPRARLVKLEVLSFGATRPFLLTIRRIGRLRHVLTACVYPLSIQRALLFGSNAAIKVAKYDNPTRIIGYHCDPLLHGACCGRVLRSRARI